MVEGQFYDAKLREQKEKTRENGGGVIFFARRTETAAEGSLRGAPSREFEQSNN